MTEYWEDESDGKPRHGVGVVRHRPHRIIRHRAGSGVFNHLAAVGCVMALVTVAAATLATSVAVRDTSAAARWASGSDSGPTSGTQSADPPSEVGPGTVAPSEDAERRTQVGASTERATRDKRPDRAPVEPAAPPSSASPGTSVPPASPPSEQSDPDPEPSTDPDPEPTPDPCDPKEPQSEPEPEPGTDPGSESTGGDSGESTGSDGGEVPPVDSEPASAQSETGS
jgi:hypothetical protein